MGKNNYSIMQRQGLSIFWKNSWSSQLNFKKYFYYFFISEKIVENIIINFFKFNLVNKNFNKNFKKRFNIKYSNDFRGVNPILVGKIWFLKFSNWVIININIFIKLDYIKIRKKNLNSSLIYSLKRKLTNDYFAF